MWRRPGTGSPAGTWPGVPLGECEVIAPWAGDGPRIERDHGRPQVLCRWPWEQSGSASSGWRSARLLDIFRLLPSGTEIGVGAGWQVSLRAGDEAQLRRPPTVHDLTEAREARLDRADWDRWGIDDRAATDALGPHVLLRAVAPGMVQYLVVVPGADQARRDDFVGLCRDHRLRDSLQLWELDQLPRWARRHADDLLAELHD